MDSYIVLLVDVAVGVDELVALFLRARVVAVIHFILSKVGRREFSCCAAILVDIIAPVSRFRFTRCGSPDLIGFSSGLGRKFSLLWVI